MWFWPKKQTKRRAAQPDKPGQPASAKPALAREVAGIATDLYEPLAGWLGVRPNRDPLLTNQQPDSAYQWPYGLFEEALDKDAHLAALIAQRKAAVLSWERRVVPADDSPAARHCAELVRRALTHIAGRRPGSGGFERALAELLDAVPYGLAVSEILWERAKVQGPRENGSEDTTQLLLPKALLARHPRRFVFTADSALRLLTAAESVKGEVLPERKFIVFAPYGRYENPYGLPQLRSVWWLAYFKRQALRFWLMFAEKYGSPTAVLKHPLAASAKEKQGYRRIIGSIQQETGLVVPEGVELTLLEAQRSGSAQTYRELAEFLNREMSKALLGQTLTTEAGERGAYALGRVHQAVRADIVRQDAQALMSAVNGQLVKWIVDLNVAPAARRYPTWQLAPPVDEDLKLQLEIDRFFNEQGLSLDPAALYARYGREPAPAAAAATTTGANDDDE